MSKAKHLPGPYRVGRGAQADAFSIEAATKTIATIKAMPECEANAYLLAAAPALLAACEAAAEEVRYWHHELLPDDYPSDSGWRRIHRQLRAAIQLATGEPT